MFFDTSQSNEQRCVTKAKDAVCSHIIAVGFRDLKVASLHSAILRALTPELTRAEATIQFKSKEGP
jgi:hypothetical protein